MEIARRRIDGLARALNDLGHFPLQHADIISARTAVHLAKSGPFPEHVKIARSAIEFVGIRRTEQPVVPRVTDVGKQAIVRGKPELRGRRLILAETGEVVSAIIRNSVS